MVGSGWWLMVVGELNVGQNDHTRYCEIWCWDDLTIYCPEITTQKMKARVRLDKRDNTRTIWCLKQFWQLVCEGLWSVLVWSGLVLVKPSYLAPSRSSSSSPMLSWIFKKRPSASWICWRRCRLVQRRSNHLD